MRTSRHEPIGHLPDSIRIGYTFTDMKSSKHLLILNPIAAKGRASQQIPLIEKYFKQRGIDYDLRVTQGVWHAAELARDAGRSGYGVVVAAGGDGTVNEVLNGLMLAHERGEKLPVMGVLAIGRGNDFAYGADIPSDLERCVDIIASRSSRPMDVGKVTGGDYPMGRYFGNGIGVGFDTIVGLEAAKLKHVHGFMAYVIGALKTFIIYPQAPLVRLDWENESLEQQSHQISIMNGKRMGGTFFMAPDSINHDGLFDLCMAERCKRSEMIGLIARYTKGTQAKSRKIRTGRAARYSISAPNGGLVVHADGETICTDGSSILVECLPSMVQILCSNGVEGTTEKES
jgi:YegS/Rv2252/BmrU family lipid kinase